LFVLGLVALVVFLHILKLFFTFCIFGSYSFLSAVLWWPDQVACGLSVTVK